MSDAAASLFLVTVDRLPAWMLSAYGSTWVSTPTCDALAARGVVFDRLIATGDDQIALLRDLVRPPAAVFPAADVTVVSDDDSAAEVLSAAGIVASRVTIRGGADAASDEAETNLARLCGAAAAAVAPGRRQMIWCHASSLGRAWDAPTAYRDAYVDPDDPPPPAGAAVPEFPVDVQTDPDLVMGVRQAFAGQLTLLDRCLAGLLKAVEQPGGSSAWTLLFAGVRGLGLGLHGRVGCGSLPPFGELVHMPAILVDAAGRMAAQRFDGLVTHADLGATLRELCGVPAAGTGVAEPWEPRSLAGLYRSWSVDRRDRVIVPASTGTAVVTPGWHLVVPGPVAGEDGGKPVLFAKPDDFFEVCDVSDRSGTVVDELAGLASTVRSGDGTTPWRTPLSPDAVGGGAA